MTQAQVDAINSGITKSIVDSRVIPSTTHPGAAAVADNADNAATASTASMADTALTANIALTAEFATVAENALSANSVNNYSETLLSGLTEDDVPVSFYILTKN